MGAHWKREVVQDHKFDFINVDDFVDNSCWRQFSYLLVFAAIIRGILVYCSDIFTAANLLANSNENSFVPKTGVQLEVFGKLPFDVYKYLFSGCILLGFLLLGLEIRRARAIIVSRDISYAFTSLIASRYYTVRSYPHFCFFAQINNSKKTVDEVAFFCFFTFRNWKRLMLADAPRQVINATILYQTFRGHGLKPGKDSIFDWNSVVGSDPNLVFKKISLGAMIFTVFMFALSLLMLLSAVILYIPLVSHIQGNLKEFCCHKIDKRIDELIRKKSRTRAADEVKNGKDNPLANMKQPTLPQVDLLEGSDDVGTPKTAYSQRTPVPYHAQTPKSQYSYPQTPRQQHQPEYTYSPAAAYGQNIPSQQQQQIQRQQQQQLQAQRGYDYYQANPIAVGKTAASGKPRDAYDPYTEPFTGDDIYDHYAADQPQTYQQTYGQSQNHTQVPVYGGAHPRLNAAGVTPKYYGNSNVSSNNNNTPTQSQRASDLDSRHSSGQYTSQAGQGYGNGPVTYSNSNSNNNGRYPRNGANTTYGNEYQSNSPRRQDGGQPRGAYRGGAQGDPGY
ncbi:hypothetical protein EDD11_003034 [Mortierella claussenii]|nr:hypothetical protein EDD11_003034 [Mortierella claussenii]